jgi:hypothetical protein
MTSLLLCVYVPESNLEIKIGCDFFPKETGCDLRRHDTCTLDFTCAVKIDTVRARFGRSRPQTLAWCALSGPERCIFCFPFFRPKTKTPYSCEQAQKGREWDIGWMRPIYYLAHKHKLPSDPLYKHLVEVENIQYSMVWSTARCPRTNIFGITIGDQQLWKKNQNIRNLCIYCGTKF